MEKSRRVVACVGLLAMLAACGGSPTMPGSTSRGGGDGLDAVLAEVEGMEGQERTDRLVELAKEAGGTVHLYTALTSDVAAKVQEAFSERYGLTLEVYRASGESITQRLLQEVGAGEPQADFVETGGTEMVAFTREGVLARYESPQRKYLIDEALVDDTWTGSRVQVFAPAWNKELVDAPPTSWEDLAAPRWNGRMAMETGNSDWYMALTEYWTEEADKSEDEVARLWRDIADGTFMVSGHSTMRELMVGGEFGAVATLYSYMTEEGAAEGAPLAWQPTVSPLIIRTQGAGIVQGGPNPAGAALLMDWWLSADGAQKIFVEADIDSVRQDLWALGNADTYAIDVTRYVDELQRWQSEFERLTRLGEKKGP